MKVKTVIKQSTVAVKCSEVAVKCSVDPSCGESIIKCSECGNASAAGDGNSNVSAAGDGERSGGGGGDGCRSRREPDPPQGSGLSGRGTQFDTARTRLHSQR